MGGEARVAGRFTEVDRALRSEGYEPRPPSAEVAAQDEGTCQRLSCTQCSKPGLGYRPYLLRDGSRGGARYRAVAVCAGCYEAFEF
jgi:hypothetical protein